MSVRIGFIGAGGISRNHLSSLLAVEEAEVVALCDLSEEMIAETRRVVNQEAEKEGLARRVEAAAYTDYRTMLRQERLDAVYICLPPFAHGAPEEAVIEAGLPMLVEKPLALDLGIAHRILTDIRQKGLWAASGYQLRYDSAVDRAREIIAGRTVGMVLGARLGGPPAKAWYRFQDKSGGQLIEMATHQIDLLRHLVGEIRTVYAQADIRINRTRVSPDYEIFDVNCMTMRFENGAVGNFANGQIAEYGTPPEARGLHIFCDGLCVSYGRAVRILSDKGTEEIPTARNPLALEDRAFVRAVAEGRPELIRSDYASGVRTLAVTIAGERSARSGKPVDVTELLAAEAPSAL